jgi:hypothetical protein
MQAQIQAVVGSTVGMVGDLQGIAGKASLLDFADHRGSE